MIRQLHYTHYTGTRQCGQDGFRGNSTTVLENVTCKKCLRSLVKKAKPETANTAYTVFVREDLKRAGIAWV